ncbi:MAG: DJ-1/PfpI family protein [Thermostichales cyanobacterium SZTDM-1c_bins_54]
MAAVLLILAPGFEEIEAVATMDILRRANLDLTVAALTPSLLVTGSHAITIQADTTLDQVLKTAPPPAQRFQALVLPGGPGTQTLHQDPRVGELLGQFAAAERLLAAICAAPTVLAAQGLLADHAATTYFDPDAYRQGTMGLPTGPIGEYRLDAVVVSGSRITSRGAGTAVAFALTLVAQLVGIPEAERIAKGIHAVWTYPG